MRNRIAHVTHYFFAILITATTAVARCELGHYANRPGLILFVVPILLSAYIGGLGPGLCATVLSALTSSYFFIPPYLSFSISGTFDGMEWLILCIVGILISSLSECLHRTVRQAKEAQQKSRESESRFRTVIESLPFDFWMMGQDGRYIMQNTTSIKIWGNVVGKLPEELNMSADDLSVWQNNNKRAFAGEVVRAEVNLVVRGEKNYFYNIISPIFDGDIIGGILGINMDLNELKRSEEELFESRQMLQLVLDNIPQRIFWKDLNSVFLGCNKTLALDCGYADPNELVGKTDYETAFAGMADIYQADDRQVMQSGVPKLNYEEPLVKPDGRPAWLRTSKMPLRDKDGKIIAVLGMYEDITERKLAEAALQENAHFLQTLMDAIPTPIFYKDVNGVYQGCNVALETCFGLHKKEIVGKSVYDIAPQELAKKYENMDMALLNQGGVQVYEASVRYADGTLHDVIFRKATFNKADGSLAGLVGVFLDISERKRAEEEKMRLESQLRQALKMEAIGQLAGGVAHDFNNLLTSIIGYSDLLLAEVPESHFAKNKIRIIRDAGNKAADLVRQLLAFSRKQMLEIKAIDINKIVQNMNKIFERTIGEHIELKLKMNKPVKNVLADAGQLEQVLMNLVVNGRDAMPNGGRLTIETADAYLDEAYALMHSQLVKSGPYVALSVTDTGIGMSHDIKERIFEPFFTTKEAGKGTGLGLSTTYGIIKQHNGYIWVYSEPGKGATFRVYLPATEEGIKETKRDECLITTKGTETILVVDDEPLVREFVIDVLQPLGYKLFEADGAEEALKIAAQVEGKIDLVLTDLIMSGMKGSDLGKLLIERWPGIKVCLMSGYGGKDIFEEGMGDIVFIQKPLTPRQLITKLREVLDEL